MEKTVYHVSDKKIVEFRSLPIFAYVDKNEAEELFSKLSNECENLYLYEFELKENINILSNSEAQRYSEFYDIECDLVSNPTEDELIELKKELESLFAKNNLNIDIVELNDYSQFDCRDDAVSYLILEPKSSIRSVKIIK